MTLAGWLTMLVSVGTVVTLFLFCLVRVLKEPEPEHLHGMNIESDDLKDEPKS